MRSLADSESSSVIPGKTLSLTSGREPTQGTSRPLSLHASWDMQSSSSRQRTNERTNAHRFYCVYVNHESDGVMGNIFLTSFDLGVRTCISLEYTLTLLHPLSLQSFNQFFHSDTAVQFQETYSLSALALSAVFKLPLADALLFNPPLIPLAFKSQPDLHIHQRRYTYSDMIFH